MNTPTTSELLVEQTRKAERLEILVLANECKSIEEFREKLKERISASK